MNSVVWNVDTSVRKIPGPIDSSVGRTVKGILVDKDVYNLKIINTEINDTNSSLFPVVTAN